MIAAVRRKPRSESSSVRSAAVSKVWCSAGSSDGGPARPGMREHSNDRVRHRSHASPSTDRTQRVFCPSVSAAAFVQRTLSLQPSHASVRARFAGGPDPSRSTSTPSLAMLEARRSSLPSGDVARKIRKCESTEQLLQLDLARPRIPADAARRPPVHLSTLEKLLRGHSAASDGPADSASPRRWRQGDAFCVAAVCRALLVIERTDCANCGRLRPLATPHYVGSPHQRSRGQRFNLPLLMLIRPATPDRWLHAVSAPGGRRHRGLCRPERRPRLASLQRASQTPSMDVARYA